MGKVFEKTEAFQYRANGFAKTETAELNKQNLLLESTCRNWGYTGAPEEPAEYPEGATEKQQQDLQKYITAAKQLWCKVEGRTHAHEHILKFLAIRLWNQLGVLQEAQGTGPEEVELDVADNDFLAAMLAVIEAHGQSQRELMGIVVGDANKQRREALEQVDDVIRKWQSTQDTCDDYKGKLEQAEFTNAAHVKDIACLQANNQSTQQSRQDAECRAAATLEEKNRLRGQLSELEQEKKQLQEDKAHLQEDKMHLQEGVNATAKVLQQETAHLRENAHLHEKAQMQEQRQAGDGGVSAVKEEVQQDLDETAAQPQVLQMSKAAKKKAKKQRKAAMQITAVTEASPEAPSPMAGASSAPAPTSGTDLQVSSISSGSSVAGDVETEAPTPASDVAAPKLTKGQKKKAKKQQKAAMQLTESSPDSPSPMANASSASSPTSGTELQVPSSPSRSSLAGDVGTEGPTPASDADAAPKLTKSQRKKANRQQKAAMQLAESSPDSPSSVAGASSVSSPTSGTEPQVSSIPSGSSLAGDAETQSPTPASDIPATPS
ncbi:hypothetical protein WJX82_008512 [Trebouxia sp. C0006]